MQLSRSFLEEKGKVLPEKVLQFGTGVLLRGLPDYFINKANNQQLFNGSIVVVKSTSNGGTDAFKQQEGVFTQIERGYENGQAVERTVVNTAISRVLSAREEWEEILACASNEAMQVIISNTTEVGITLVPEDAHAERPVSFPGRLLHFLLKRFEAFNGSKEAGMAIIPTELIVDNAHKLKTILLQLAEMKGCSSDFCNWLQEANDFCNSLVDRIVPGKLGATETTALEKQLGYRDDLMIMSECYRLWAIETNSERTRKILSFSAADAGVILAPDINKFRELKLRLLNGTHTFSCGLACLAGFTTVKEAMLDETFAAFVAGLMMDEIVPLVAGGDISTEEARTFATQVIDRFRNTYIEHLWINITVQYTSKMVMRNIPLLEKYFATNGSAPTLMSLGFAAYLLFLKPGAPYKVEDDKAGLIVAYWNRQDEPGWLEALLSDKSIWGNNLTIYPGFAETIHMYLAMLTGSDAGNILRSVMDKRSESV